MSSPFAAAPTPRQAALATGYAYVVVIVLGLFANFFVRGRLTDPADIAGNVLLFRGGVAAFLVVLIADIVVAWGLYVVLRPANRDLSLFAAWFRLVYVAIAVAALWNLPVAARLAVAGNTAQVPAYLDAYTDGWSLGLVLFGVHLVLAGLVIIKSGHVPSALGILVVLAGVGYAAGKLVSILLPAYNDPILAVTGVLAVPGEFGLTGWLLWRGGRDRRPG